MSGGSPALRVSVVMPAYRSEDRVAASLTALRAQTYRDFEIVLVNSYPDGTAAIVANGFPEVVFEQSEVRLLPHAARNRGVAKARGELLVFTDPDCRPDSRWLERLVAACDSGHPVVGGAIELEGGGRFARGVHLAKFYWLLSGLPAGVRRIVCSGNACYSRSAWETVGPFDAEFSIGDALLSWRASTAGLEPWFEPNAVVRGRQDRGVRQSWREFRARGRELAEARACLERWPRRRAAAYVLLAPLVLATVLGRAALATFAARRRTTFVGALPALFFCRLAWTVGEAGYLLDFVRGHASPRSLRRSPELVRRALRT